MNKTKIPWCDVTWNPVTGCTPISAGCANCYARRMARRLAGRCGYPEAPREFDVTVHQERLDEPTRLKKPKRIFVCSMSDLFHDDVPFYFIEAVWRAMKAANHHTFMILTKRPERAYDFLLSSPVDIITKNVWLGITIESQDYIERLYEVTNLPASNFFISFEPLLGEVTIDPYWLSRFSLVIVGCESGPNRRFTSRQWIRSLRDQCLALGNDRPAFFLKQMDVGGRVVSMPELDGRTWAEMPRGEKE